MFSRFIRMMRLAYISEEKLSAAVTTEVYFIHKGKINKIWEQITFPTPKVIFLPPTEKRQLNTKETLI